MRSLTFKRERTATGMWLVTFFITDQKYTRSIGTWTLNDDEVQALFHPTSQLGGGEYLGINAIQETKV